MTSPFDALHMRFEMLKLFLSWSKVVENGPSIKKGVPL